MYLYSFSAFSKSFIAIKLKESANNKKNNHHKLPVPRELSLSLSLRQSVSQSVSQSDLYLFDKLPRIIAPTSGRTVLLPPETFRPHPRKHAGRDFPIGHHQQELCSAVGGAAAH